MELAGGEEALMDLFASRLRTVLAPHDYDVGHSWAMVAAFKNEGESPRPFFSLIHCRPLPRDALIECVWEGLDLRRDELPPRGTSLPPSDPFVMLYASIRDLISEWPEVIVERQ